MLPSLLIAAALAGPCRAEPSADHRAPAESLAEPKPGDSGQQSLLAEMWQRRLLSSESRSWTAEDLDTLMKLRSAEDMGAVGLLRRKLGNALGGLVVPYKAAGATSSGLRLTKDGYEKWRFLRAQGAIELFEAKEVGAGEAFHLEDLDGRKLFDSEGLLTSAGDYVYNRALANLPIWWKLPASGEVFGNRAPPKPKPPVDASTIEVPAGPEHAALLNRVWQATWGGSYEPVLRRSDMGKLRIVMEHDTSGRAPRGFVVVVKRAADEHAARAEFARKLKRLQKPGPREVMTVEEKLAAIDEETRELPKKVGAKESWAIDRAAVEKQLRDLLKGKLAVVWVTAGPPPPEPAPQPEAASAPGASAPPPGGDQKSGSPTAPPPEAAPSPDGAAAPPPPADDKK